MTNSDYMRIEDWAATRKTELKKDILFYIASGINKKDAIDMTLNQSVIATVIKVDIFIEKFSVLNAKSWWWNCSDN